MRFFKLIVSSVMLFSLASISHAASLHQGAWVKNTDSYQYGHRSIPNIQISGAPADTDWSRWAMLHDGQYYRLYAGKKGVKNSLYQFAFNRSTNKYQFGYQSIRELKITGAPSDARFYDFAMLHDGRDYRLYLKSKSKPNRLYQFAWKKGTNQYQYGHNSIKVLTMSGFPRDTNWSRWQMLHDGRHYRAYFGKGKSNSFYQAAFNRQTNRYEYGYQSIPTLSMKGFPASNRVRTAMLHDGQDFRFYSLSTPRKVAQAPKKPAAPKKPKTQGKWLSAQSGYIPGNAVIGGYEANGERLYVCRAQFNNGVHIGKISKSLKTCHFGWGGRERQASSYEVLAF